MPTLPPEEQAPYFDIKETTFVNPANGTKIVVADTQRVALLFSTVSGGGNISVSLAASGATGRGMSISNATPLLLTQHDVASLVTQEWFYVSAVVATVSVIEVFLRRRPGRGLEGLAP